MGPYNTTTGASIHVLGARSWLNRTTQTTQETILVSTGLSYGVIDSVATVAPNTPDNRAFGSGLEGVYSGTISNPNGSETVQAFAFLHGTEAYFNSGDLTGIDANAELTLLAAPLSGHQLKPKEWQSNFSNQLIRSDYSLDPDGDFQTLTQSNQGIAYGRLDTSMVTDIQIGDVVTIEQYVLPGQGGQGYFGLKSSGSGGNFTCNGNIEIPGALGLGQVSTGTNHSCTVTDSLIFPGIKVVTMEFTATEAGEVAGGAGPYATAEGSSITVVGFRSWKNRAMNTESINHPVDILDPNLHISSVDTVSPNTAQIMAYGVGLDGAYRGVIYDDEDNESIQAFGSENGTSVYFNTGPLDNMGPNAILSLDIAPLSDHKLDPGNWGDNFNSQLTRTEYISSFGNYETLTQNSNGIAWGRLDTSLVASASQGDIVTVEFYVVAGNGGEGYFGVKTNSQNFTCHGDITVSQSLTIGQTDMGSSHACNIEDYKMFPDVKVVTMEYTVTENGEVKGGVGPYKVAQGSSINVIGFRSWIDRDANTQTRSRYIGGPF